jgi:hypothetical protein
VLDEESVRCSPVSLQVVAGGHVGVHTAALGGVLVQLAVKDRAVPAAVVGAGSACRLASSAVRAVSTQRADRCIGTLSSVIALSVAIPRTRCLAAGVAVCRVRPGITHLGHGVGIGAVITLSIERKHTVVIRTTGAQDPQEQYTHRKYVHL